MLSQIGGVVLPERILRRMYQGEKLSGEEMQLFEIHPMVRSDLLAKIPRMEPIARMIGYQEKHFDGSAPLEKPRTEIVDPSPSGLMSHLAASLSSSDAAASSSSIPAL